MKKIVLISILGMGIYGMNLESTTSTSFAANNNGQETSDQIRTAYEEGHLDIVQNLLKRDNINIDVTDKVFRYLFHDAVRKGYLEIVRLLVEKGVDVNVKDYGGNNPLCIASEEGNIEIVKYLVKQNGIDVNIQNRAGETPLYIASQNGSLNIAKVLVKQNGIDINKTDYSLRDAPLHVASEEGHLDIVRLLVEQDGIDINKTDDGGRTALSMAYSKGYSNIVNLLLNQPEIDVNCGMWTLLYDAASHGDLALVQRIVQQDRTGINSTEPLHGETALHVASREGYLAIVKCLVEQGGIDINIRNRFGKTAIDIAKLNGHDDIVQFLIEKHNQQVLKIK